MDEGVLTSASRDVTETAGGGWYFHNLVLSKPSLSFNTPRNSEMERSRAASNDMMVDGENAEARVI